MDQFVAQVIRENGLLLFTASVIISVCVIAVLCAVALNFMGAQGSGGKVKREKKSFVATLSMLAFFVCFYLLVHHRVYELPMEPGAARATLIVVGTLLVVAGAAVNILGRFNLGRNWANQVTVFESQELVDTGVFALVRHPLYASLLWMFTGAGIVFLNLPALAITYLVFLPMMYYRARQEEIMLEAELAGYREYRQRVGMFWPRPGRGESGSSAAVSRYGFAFCRWGVTVILWAAFLLKSPVLVAVATAILALNVLLGIGWAPMIVAWDLSLGRLLPSPKTELNVQAMRFAHAIGTAAGICALALILGKAPEQGWIVLVWFAAFKTAGAMGFCLISRSFSYIAQHGDCCRFLCGRLKKPPGGDPRNPLP